MITLPYRPRRESGCELNPAQEYTIMFKLAGGDYYHVPVTEVQRICPELQATIEQAVQDGTAMTHVFEVPRILEQDWKDWWTISDYIAQGKFPTHNPRQTRQDGWEGGHGCELPTYEPVSSFLTDAHVHILSTHHGLPAGAEAAEAATRDRAAGLLDCLTDTGSLFDTREALSHLESLIAAARLACQWGDPCAEGGLRAAVAAACETLGPLLAELPALWDAVADDERFAELWWGLEGSRSAAGGLALEVRERMRWVVEGRELSDAMWFAG